MCSQFASKIKLNFNPSLINLMDIQNIHCVAILDKAGQVLIKREHKKTNTQTIFDKIKTEKDEITIVDDILVVYRNLEDTIIFICSGLETNDIFLYKALDAFYISLISILKNDSTTNNVMCLYDQVVLLLDSFVYEGILMEDDPDKLISAVGTRPFESLEGMKIPKGFASMFGKASKTFRR